MSRNAYFCILDILGFKELVNNNDHSRLENIYEGLCNAIKKSVSENNVSFEGESDKTIAIIDNKKYRLGLKAYLISDSILLWSNGGTYREFIDITSVIRSLLYEGFKIGCPLRGCLSFGELTSWDTKLGVADYQHAIKLNTVFGKNVVRAYEMEKQQEWSGCIVDSVAIAQFEDYCIYLREERGKDDFYGLEHFLDKHPVFLKYAVPKKNNFVVKEEYVVNWTWRVHYTEGVFLTDQEVVGAFAQHNKGISHRGVMNKIKNTLAFKKHAEKINALSIPSPRISGQNLDPKENHF